ncbi:hypothetical protein [Hoeflea ulvae]|uniref:Uncharacterized protein n=1 Tax=Hoeflea ulvae TaxID=2983764 RepID=A0ABT3YDF4_9HYPH|nr:hypothetical protein [Hoeflea ulvae]MCY0093923.1 hypothetical protein [Hoeflea ulvae]
MADSKGWPPVLLYGVIINEAIRSGDKDVMQAVAKVSEFMMGRADDDGSEMISDWHAAHKDLMKALN